MQHLLLKTDENGVATVTLNRPDVHNAFNDALIGELYAVFSAFSGDDSVRAVVLRGAGKSFCAGADLAEMKTLKEASEAQNIAQAEKLSAMYHALNRCAVPVIGVTHGAALGGGTGLASVCDVVIALPDSKFGLTEVKLGIVPAVISPFVMAKIGESHARALFLTGALFNGDEAHRIGLVHHVAQDDAALETLLNDTLAQILRNGPQAVRLAKRLIADLPQQADIKTYTTQLIAKARTSDEGQEGMAAFLEKRKAQWVVA